MTSTNIVLALVIARFLQSAEYEMSTLDRVVVVDEIFGGFLYWDQKLLRLLLWVVCVNICRLLFGLKFLLGAEDRAHGCTREFSGHSDIALRSYTPTFHPARIRKVEWGHSALEVRKETDRLFYRNGIRAPKWSWGTSSDVRRWRASVRPFHPGTRRYKNIHFWYFLSNKFCIKNLVGLGMSRIVGN